MVPKLFHPFCFFTSIIVPTFAADFSITVKNKEMEMLLFVILLLFATSTIAIRAGDVILNSRI